MPLCIDQGDQRFLGWYRIVDKNRRNTLVVIGAIGLGYAGLRVLPGLFPETLELEPIAHPPGFRKYVAGETSGGFDPFVGLNMQEPAEAAAMREAADRRVRENICATLYGGLDLTGSDVPMASFSDYYCPYCRVQTKRLADMVRSGDIGVSVAWHELPLLGESSNLAAKAALAAKRQGAYPEFHARLMRSPFRATPEYLETLAKDIDVDGSQLVEDMNSPETSRELEDSAALARLFAFVGTPALVIGRTVVQGQISDQMIRRIVELEREEGWSDICPAA